MFIVLFLVSLLPPSGVKAVNTPNDAGGSIRIAWQVSPDDKSIDGYAVFRAEGPDTVSCRIGSVGAGVSDFEDDQVDDRKTYSYQVAAFKDSAIVYSASSSQARSGPEWFHFGRLNVLIGFLLFSAFVLYYVGHVKKGKQLFVRKIPGLDAVEEAIGRATEMGKPILYVPGMADVDYTATIASMSILSEVAKKVATYETPLLVVNRMPVVYTISKEVVKEAYTAVGRPDAFKEDYVRFLTDSQFGFAAGVDGIMMREKPATNFFIGYFWAEALVLAETGSHSGAIQIAGTDAVMQLPFFITACDYTLIGEELYAASAYLSRNPILLSTLRAQDLGKLIVMILLLGFSVVSFFLKFDVLRLLAVG